MRLATATPPPNSWLVLRIGFTAALLIILWYAADSDKILQALTSANPVWVGAAVCCLLAQTVLSAVRWKITAAQLGQHLPLGLAVREYFLSTALNQALPGAVMGDAARAVRARAQAGLLIAGQAVAFERLAGQIAMFAVFVVAFMSTDLASGGLVWPNALRTTLYVTVLLCCTVLGGLVLAGKLPLLEPLRKALFARPVVAQQIMLGAGITVLNLAAFAFAARATGVHLSGPEVVTLVPVILFAMLVPLTVSGWGVREGAAALVLPLANVTVAESVAASILFGVAILIAALPGTLAGLRS